MIFRFKNKIFLLVFKGITFDKKIAFILGKTDINHFDFEITLSSLLSIHFAMWKDFKGYSYLTLNIILFGFSLFIACEDNKNYK